MAFWIDLGKSLSVAATLLGCASRAEARPSPKAPAKVVPVAAPVEANHAQPPAAAATGASPNAESGAPVAPLSNPSSTTGEAPRALPELALQLSGLHIGGGPNDATTKRPFIETLESGFDALRACYVKVDQPEKGGTFGVDLRVERNGGHPTVQAVRTVMKGDAFKTCVEEAFRGLEFARPAKGPTVLSASVRFSLQP